MTSVGTEKWLKRLEDDANGLDKAYQRLAKNLTVETTEANYTSSGQYNSAYGNRIVVTFKTSGGGNTLAVLGLTSSASNLIQCISRCKYDDGARWIIVATANNSISYHFQVKSLLKGTISVTEAAHG